MFFRLTAKHPDLGFTINSFLTEILTITKAPFYYAKQAKVK